MRIMTLLALLVFLEVIVQAQTKITTETQARVAVVQTKQQLVVPRRVALIVQNHASGADFSMIALTDALSANLSGHGLQAINPYNAIGINQNRSTEGEKTPTVLV